MKKINIAIDGPVASGKSTIAALLAKKLNYKHISSGLLYRSIAYFVYKNKLNCKNEKEIIKLFKQQKFKWENSKTIFLNDEDITKKIEQILISNLSSKIATYQLVRSFCVEKLQKNLKNKGIVMDGRDIASVVIPDAELKIFLDASLKVRAKRQNKQFGEKYNFQTILKKIKARDKNDSERKIEPLKKVAEAIIINTTKLSIEQTITKILQIINQRFK